MQEQAVARFEHAGDVREMFAGTDGEKIVVRESVSGPSAVVAYGQERRDLRVSLSPEAVSALLEAVGFAGAPDGLWDYLTSEWHDIVDLMDLCDRRGIAYEFASTGPGGDWQFRPAAAR